MTSHALCIIFPPDFGTLHLRLDQQLSPVLLDRESSLLQCVRTSNESLLTKPALNTGHSIFIHQIRKCIS